MSARTAFVARAAVAASLIVGLSLAGSSTARAADPADRFALGDSVMLGAKSDLKATGFGVVDAEESRQAYTGAAELRRRGASLPANVVIHLGTNGTFPLSSCKAMVKAAGVERRVFLVTIHVPRSWQKGNNAVIRACADSYPEGRVTVVDWDWAASRHPAWLYSDGTHLKPAGAAAYARLIDTAIDSATDSGTDSAIDSGIGAATAGSARIT